MKNRITALSVILTVIIILTFAGCNNGHKIYVDPVGSTYYAVTDEKGNTVLNNEGNIVVYQTDDNGDIITDTSGVYQTVANYFPEQIIKGDFVQTPTYTLTLPGGWSAQEDDFGKYTKKSADASVEISIIENFTLEKYQEYTETFIKMLKEKTTGEESISYKQDTFHYTAANTEAIRYTLVREGGSNDSTTIMLVFKNHGNLYKILFEAPTANLEKANFTEFYSAIKYKNYQYYEVTTTVK